MPSLDTNAVLRWLLGDVPEQSALVERLLDSGTSHDVDDLALVEVVYVLERRMKLSRPLIADAIGIVLASAAIQLDRTLWREAMGLYVGHPKLSITDICLVVRATRRRALPLRTFDAKLARQLDGAERITAS